MLTSDVHIFPEIRFIIHAENKNDLIASHGKLISLESKKFCDVVMLGISKEEICVFPQVSSWFHDLAVINRPFRF